MLYFYVCFIRCSLRDKEVECREKETEIKDLKEKTVEQSSLIRKEKLQNADLAHQLKMMVCIIYCLFFFPFNVLLGLVTGSWLTFCSWMEQKAAKEAGMSNENNGRHKYDLRKQVL